MRSTGKALAAIVCIFCSFQGHGALAQEKPSEEKAKVNSSVDLPMEVEEILSTSDNPKSTRPVDPEVRLADNMVKSVSQVEIEWRQAADRLDKAVNAQKTQFNLFSEAETAAAMEAYAIKLKASGEDLLKAYAELTRRNIELKGVLTRGPTYLREVATMYERYGNEEPYEDIKQQYFDLRDIWLARAKLFEKRGSEIGDHYDKDMIPYLKGWNRFLDRLIPTLEYHFPFDRANEEEYTRFARQLADHMERLNKLTDAIGQWRAKALEQAESPEVRQEETKAKTSAIMAPFAVPFARDRRAKEVALLEPPQGGSLFPLDTVLIVRPSPVSLGLEFVASAKVVGDPTKMELLQDFSPSDADFALMPWAELPSTFRCEDSLRKSLAVSRELNRKHAATYSELTQLLYGAPKSPQKLRVDLEWDLFRFLERQTFILWPNYRQGTAPPRHIAQLFYNPSWNNPFTGGSRVTLYRISTLMDAGSATVISKGSNYMVLKSDDGRAIVHGEDVLFTPSAERAVSLAWTIDPEATVRAARRLRDKNVSETNPSASLAIF